MECLIGIVAKDCVVVASDMLSMRSIVVLKSTEDRSRVLNNHNLILYSGDAGDCVQFVEFIQRNMQLREMQHGREMSTQACASFTRLTLAENLRKQMYATNVLVAGHSDAPRLYFIDYLASCHEVPYACHGYAQFFCFSTLDRYYKPEMSREDAIKLIHMCIAELKTRFIANLSSWRIQVVDKDGIHVC